MAEGRAEDARAVVVVGPDGGVIEAVLFTLGDGERFRGGPEFFDDVELVHGRDPRGWEAAEGGVVGGDGADGIVTLMIVLTAGDAEEFAPFVGLQRAVSVHRAVYDDGRRARAVGGEDFGNVGEVVGVGEALVVDDDVVGFGPVGVVVEFDFAAGGLAALVDDGPGDVAEFFDAFGESLGLEVVVVATAAGDEEGADGF